MPRVRSLPIRVAPITGEALDSWLDALSARLDSTLGELTVGSGILEGTATFYGQQQRMLRQLIPPRPPVSPRSPKSTPPP